MFWLVGRVIFPYEVTKCTILEILILSLGPQFPWQCTLPVSHNAPNLSLRLMSIHFDFRAFYFSITGEGNHGKSHQ